MIDTSLEDYTAFLKSKAPIATARGFEPKSKPHKSLKPHQVDICNWAIQQGQAAIFASFGLGKSRIQLQLCKWIHDHTGGKVLIVAPLGVRQEFTRKDGPAMGMKIVYCRNDAEITKADTPYIITNYERVRDGDITASQFAGCTLDEASCLRSYGTETTLNFVQMFKHTAYKFLATATPCPNEYIELINYADYLGVMDRGQCVTRFFCRDSKEAGNLQLYPHEEERFWLWVATWGCFLSRPSDLGHDDEGYSLPKLKVHWHTVSVDYSRAVKEQDDRGQSRLIPKTSGGVQEVAKERRETAKERISAAKEIIDQYPDDSWIIWHYLESERHEIQRLIPEAKAVYGSQDLEEREDIIVDFSDGKFRILSAKPQIAGSGCNFQKHCHKAIFVGPTDKFNDFIQAVHRIYRFLQTKEVEVHIVAADTQHETVTIMKRKWKRHDALIERMQNIIKKHGLNQSNIKQRITRMSGVERKEVAGKSFRAINNDCVVELKNFADNSIDQVVTSIPFSDHYEYSPNYNDFGHNNGDDGFFKQFDFLVPELLRVLKPGRVACIHTKDRIQYGVMTGTGMYSVNEFSDKTVAAFKKHGFIYMGRIVIDTDVVRENAQTYRLGHTRNSKDSTVMGCGSTEYVLLFRKWEPSMSPNNTAVGPEPVTKDKDDYTRGRWQIHASGVWRSDGNELVSPAMLANMSVSGIYHWWKEYCDKHGYNYPSHVEFTEAVEAAGKLPATMMLFAPHSNNPYVWTDIARIKTLNTDLKRKTTESHVCLAKGSLVLTFRGYVPIEDVRVGDWTLTHKGRWREIIAKRMTGCNPVVRVNAQGVPGLTLTPTHRVWARDSKGVSHPKQKAMKETPDWVESQNLMGCYVNQKLPEVEVLSDDPELTSREWWMVGRWIADGHYSKRNQWMISCGNDKLAKLRMFLGQNKGAEIPKTGCTQMAMINLPKHMKTILHKCGKGAGNKQIPIDALTGNIEVAKSLLDGYFSGNGHYVEERGKWMATTISKPLAFGLSMLIQRAYGVIATVSPGRIAGTTVIEGRTVNTQQEWVVQFPLEYKRGGSYGFIADDGAWKKVNSVEPFGETETWNIRVDEDESYTAEGCIVKNCPLQLDVIERLIERYSNPGETILDPFGGLMSVPYQAIQIGRKGVGIELNYDYWKYGVGFCESIENKQHAPTLFDWMESQDNEQKQVAEMADGL